MGDEVHAQDLRRRLARGRGALDHLDPASLAAPAGMDLSLDDHHLAAGLGDERLGGGLRLVRAERRVSLRDGDTEALEDLLGLILVDLHGRLFPAPA
jgi:hypothetical protein